MWVNHVAVRATFEKQDAVRERMTDAGIKPLMDIDHGWCRSLYYVDPNGIMIELCVDTPGIPADADEALAVMRAPMSGATA